MIKIILCVLYVCFSVSGLTLVKLGSTQIGGQVFVVPILDLPLSGMTFLGIACYGISFCLYLGVISKFDLGIAIPILGGIINVLILLISWFILKEKLTPNAIIGALIITVGVIIMNIKK